MRYCYARDSIMKAADSATVSSVRSTAEKQADEPPVAPADTREECPVCSTSEWRYVMSAQGLTFFSCENCELMRLHPRPSSKTLEAIRLRDPGRTIAETANEEAARAGNYWQRLKELAGNDVLHMRVLLFSPSVETLIEAGHACGFQNIDVWDGARSGSGEYDLCLAVFAVERQVDPAATIQQLHQLLKTGGKLLVVTPLMDSWPANLCRDAWAELRPENRYYFRRHTIRAALLRRGFHHIWIEPDRRSYTVDRIARRARAYPRTWLTTMATGACRLIPRSLRNAIQLPIPTSAFLVSATKTDQRHRPKLSIVMPVYNERATFAECFDAVRAKQIAGVDKEIVVVESNSSDGTREIVQRVCEGEGIRLVLQEKASGKGNAVRAGFQHVDGDIVLIQDADLEYDVNDYDELVKPILQHRAAFVLGSRHSGSWKLRKFSDDPLIASVFNVGHLFFCGAINVMFGQSMKDPFTMYKVFQRDCLYGLQFECDRFDFDFELLIKLVRKGYRPLELPVNYRARSLNEGKKVTVFRDPLTWLRALLKYRFQKIDARSEEPEKLNKAGMSVG